METEGKKRGAMSEVNPKRFSARQHGWRLVSFRVSIQAQETRAREPIACVRVRGGSACVRLRERLRVCKRVCG